MRGAIMRSTRLDAQADIVYGVHALWEVLKAKKRRILRVYTTRPEPQAFGQIKAELLRRQIPVVYKERAALTALVGAADHQAIVALVTPFVYRAQPFNPAKQPCIVLLDGIQDTRNVGAIIRSAYCTGFSGIIVPRKNTAPINAATIKASAGLAEHLHIYQPPSTSAALLEVQKAGYQVYVTALAHNALDAAQVTYQKPLCLVIGSEGTGVSKQTLARGTVIKLPQTHGDISYNASVAAGIVMFLIAVQQKLI